MNSKRPPAELDNLTEVIGADAVLALVENFGGTRVYIPRNPQTSRQGSPLAEAIGLPAALALANFVGGETLKVPLAKVWRIYVYNERGLTQGQIARKVGCDWTTVQKHLGLRRLREEAEAVA